MYADGEEDEELLASLDMDGSDEDEPGEQEGGADRGRVAELSGDDEV